MAPYWSLIPSYITGTVSFKKCAKTARTLDDAIVATYLFPSVTHMSVRVKDLRIAAIIHDRL
jgi:hypothetical protein